MKVNPRPASEQTQAEWNEFQELQKRILFNLPTTISIEQEYALQREVFTDPMQSGEKLFAVLAWGTGATAEELLRIKWNDIHDLRAMGPSFCNDQYILIGNPKPENARYVPIGTHLTNFLQKRYKSICNHIQKAHRKKLTDDEFNKRLGDKYVCCEGEDYMKPCSLESAASSLRELLLSIGVDKDVLRYMELYIKFELKPAERTIETLPEIYLFRRTMCTILAAFQVDNKGISYMLSLSYDDEISAKALRDEYMDAPANVIRKLATACARRPFFNPLPEWYVNKEPITDIMDDRYILAKLYDVYKQPI